MKAVITTEEMAFADSLYTIYSELSNATECPIEVEPLADLEEGSMKLSIRSMEDILNAAPEKQKDIIEDKLGCANFSGFCSGFKVGVLFSKWLRKNLQ